jgi:hypothetical protein
MKFSVREDAIHNEATYTAPDPRFMTTLSMFSKGFPWEQFLVFFKEKQLISCDAEDQVFLLRLLAIQEFLCLNDETLISWSKHQFQLIGFLHRGYKANTPSAKLLADFRATLDAVGILSPFRQQCQKIIMMHDEKCLKKNHKSLVIAPSKKGSRRIIGIKIDETKLEKDATWVTCPICKSQNINKVQSPHWSVAKEERCCRCRFCGNKFVI